MEVGTGGRNIDLQCSRLRSKAVPAIVSICGHSLSSFARTNVKGKGNSEIIYAAQLKSPLSGEKM